MSDEKITPEQNDPQAPEQTATASETQAPSWGSVDDNILSAMASEFAEGDADVTEMGDKISKLIEALQAENLELKDRSLRLAAEMENLRRRTEKEVRDANTYGITKFARDVLSVSDNLSRAIEAVPSDTQDPGLKSLLEGVEATERELQNALQRHGVEKFDPSGEKFDPNQHQAMMEVPDPSVPNGTVMHVMQAGYRIGERVLRPALVGVSKGGPKVAPAPAPEETLQSVEETAPTEAGVSDTAQETSDGQEAPGATVNRTA